MKNDDKNNRLPICMLVGVCLGASVGLVVGAICGNVTIGLFGIPIGSGLGIVFGSIRKKEMSYGRTNKKKVWIDVIFALLLIMGIAAIYLKWNEIWYDFGRNLYNLFNN